MYWVRGHSHGHDQFIWMIKINDGLASNRFYLELCARMHICMLSRYSHVRAISDAPTLFSD